MDRIVEKVVFNTLAKPNLTRVAAYGRVSSGKDTMLHSLSAQVSYYSQLIQNHKDWIYCGVYVDEAITGTKEGRENFQRLMSDCRAGKIDLVITKSISRFARNTVTLLEAVRELKALGIGVYFEEQNINTLTADGELMLTILASYAQEESRSVSENQKWGVRRNFENGIPWSATILGYRLINGVFEIEPNEAEIVKRIFNEYLSGKGTTAIAKLLNAEGVKTRNGNKWTKNSILLILKNYTYTGNLLLQKTFYGDYLTKQKQYNNGEMPMYHVQSSHLPIIDMDTYTTVQEEIENRAKTYISKTHGITYPFTSLITCGQCGKHYRRKKGTSGAIWICSTFNTYGKANCQSKQIPETILNELTLDISLDTVQNIVADNGNKLTFVFKDGTELIKYWKDRSRKNSWTEEMREQARQRNYNRRSQSE